MVRRLAHALTLTMALGALTALPAIAAEPAARVRRDTREALRHQLRLVDRRMAAVRERAQLRDRSSSLDEVSRFFGEADPRRRLVALSSAGGASRPGVAPGQNEDSGVRSMIPVPVPQKTVVSQGLARRLIQWKIGRSTLGAFADDLEPDSRGEQAGNYIPLPPPPPAPPAPPVTGGGGPGRVVPEPVGPQAVGGQGDSAQLQLRDLLNPQLVAGLQGGLQSADPEVRLGALARLRHELARRAAALATR